MMHATGKTLDPRWSAARRILAVRLDNLGDVLVTTPALHALKSASPDVHLTLMASPIGAQAAALNPDVDDVIVYQAPWMDPWRRLDQNPRREHDMIARLAEGSFDAAVIFTSFRQSPLPSAYMTYLAGIPLRLAASIDGPGSLLTDRHKHPETMMHEVERGLDLVDAVGFPIDERRMVLAPTEEARGRVNALLRDRTDGRGPLVVLHPGCSMEARTYPWEMFADVAGLLVETLGATVMLTGAEDERDLVQSVYEKTPAHCRDRVVKVAGALSFPELCALIERADLTVTNNTGPMHVSAAVRTPVVALFALTNPPEQWGPWQVPHRQLYHDVPCRICYSRVCPIGHECLRLVSPTQVVDAAAGLLSFPEDAPTIPLGLVERSVAVAAPALEVRT